MFLSVLRPGYVVRPDLEDTAQLPPWQVAANELGDLVPGNRWQSVGYARSGGRATEVTLQHFVILHLRPPGLPRQVPLGPGALGSPCGKKGYRIVLRESVAAGSRQALVPSSIKPRIDVEGCHDFWRVAVVGRRTHSTSGRCHPCNGVVWARGEGRRLLLLCLPIPYPGGNRPEG